MKKIKILFILPKTQQGGAETQMLNILKYINKKIFSVYLGTLYEHNQLKAEFIKLKNVKIINFEKKNKFDLFVYFKIAKFAKRNQIDIIQTFLGNHHSYLPASIYKKAIAIGGIRGTHDKDMSFVSKINEFTIPKRLTKINKFNLIANSYAAKDLYLKKGFPPNKIHVISNGIDINHFSKGNKQTIIKEFSLNKKFVIGIVARLTKEKNHELILTCLKKLLEKHKNLTLLIVGDGPEKTNLEELTKKLNITREVIFTGNRKDIKNILSAIDIFLFPSKSEGWPNVVGEAMAAGVPVIAYPVGDIEKIIKTDITGIISKPNDLSFLKNIDNLIMDNKKREFIAKNAKKYIKQNFQVINMVKSYENLYIHILNLNKN